MFSCAGCHRTFKLDYPKFGDDEVKYQALHVVEFIADYMTVHCPACGKYNDLGSEHCANDFCPKYSKKGEKFPPELHENKIVITKKWDKGPVTWHDPCHTIRHICHTVKEECYEIHGPTCARFKCEYDKGGSSVGIMDKYQECKQMEVLNVNLVNNNKDFLIEYD